MFHLRTLLRAISFSFKKIYISPPALILSSTFLASIPSVYLKTKQEQQERSGELLIVQSIDELLNKNLQGFQLIWYEMNGNEKYDSEILELLRKFIEERTDLLTTKFKVVAIKSNSVENVGKQQLGLAIIKKQDQSVIPLGKYLSFNNGIKNKDLKYKLLFDRLSMELDEVLSVGAPNLRQFTKQLKSGDYTVLMVGDDSKKYKTKFKNFINSKSFFAGDGYKYIVTDELSKNYLGLSDKEKGKVFVLIKKHSNVLVPSNQVVSIDGDYFYVYNSEEITNKLIFPPFIQKSSSDSLVMKVSIDLNQKSSQYMNRLRRELQKIANDQNHPLNSIPKFIYKQNKQAVPMEVTLQKNNHDQVINVYHAKCKKSDAEKEDLIMNSHKWKYKGEINAQKLGKWAQKVIEGKQQQYFETEKQTLTEDGKPMIVNSEKITGQDYLETVEKSKEKPILVFHFAQNCFSCKKFKHIYEEIAGQKSKQMEFYRINNNHNKSKGLTNFHSTPVFLMYRNMHSFVYKNKYFTKSYFQQFVEITKSFSIMNYSSFQKHIKEHMSNENLIKQLLV